MLTEKSSRIVLSLITVLAILMFTSCDMPLSEGDVYQKVNNDMRIGADKSEIRKHLTSLEVKGDKPIIHEYKGDPSKYPVYAFDGKLVEVGGIISAEFKDRVIFGKNVWLVVYFDKSDKLINYFVD